MYCRYGMFPSGHTATAHHNNVWVHVIPQHLATVAILVHKNLTIDTHIEREYWLLASVFPNEDCVCVSIQNNIAIIHRHCHIPVAQLRDGPNCCMEFPHPKSRPDPINIPYCHEQRVKLYSGLGRSHAIHSTSAIIKALNPTDSAYE